MKILIIGSKGFIGSHCLTYFGNNNQYDVWGADVVTDYTSTNYFLIDPSTNDFNKIFSKEAFDICINCSGAASVPDSLNNPKRDFYLNTLNVFNLLDAIKEHSPECRFINLSSAAVYGSPEALPIKENQIINPISPYGFHKKLAEDICHEYYRFFNINCCSLRVFSAYGPGLKKQLFWDIFQKSKQSNTITLFGTGKESRDFIFINDIVHAIEILVHNTDCFKGTNINLASGKEFTIKEVVQILLHKINWKGELKFSGQIRKGDPLNWRADISILENLGFQSKFDIEDGLSEYAKWLISL
ncbi:MAG: NAD-dependent epimerase/dehydratase family protein [Bacteroidetes bacterium]|nr:NAD-dependent epimerase/dehydratase family protein [Bacteroidota bacterium]